MSEKQTKTSNDQEHNEDSSVNLENDVEISKEKNDAIDQIDYKTKYLRSLADLENSRKQTVKQLEDVRNYSIHSFAKELLIVLDIFDKALVSVDENNIVDETFKNFVFGINLTKQELLKVFERFNIKSLGDELLNTKFNADYHEALQTKADPSLEGGTIFQVYEHGYTLNNRLLRAAKVGIIKS